MIDILHSMLNILYVPVIDFIVLCVTDIPGYFILPMIKKADEQAQAIDFWNRSEVRFYDKMYTSR